MYIYIKINFYPTVCNKKHKKTHNTSLIIMLCYCIRKKHTENKSHTYGATFCKMCSLMAKRTWWTFSSIYTTVVFQASIFVNNWQITKTRVYIWKYKYITILFILFWNMNDRDIVYTGPAEKKIGFGRGG